jgi:hypothetical protein
MARTASRSNRVLLVPFAEHRIMHPRRHGHPLVVAGKRPERLVNPRLWTAMRPET